MSGGAQVGGMGAAGGGATAGGFSDLSRMMQNIPDDRLFALAESVNPDVVKQMIEADPGVLLPDTDPGMSDVLNGRQTITPSPQVQPRTPSLSPQALSSLTSLSASQSPQNRTPQASAVAPAGGRGVNVQASAYNQPRQPVQQRGGLAQILGRR